MLSSFRSKAFENHVTSCNDSTQNFIGLYFVDYFDVFIILYYEVFMYIFIIGVILDNKYNVLDIDGHSGSSLLFQAYYIVLSNTLNLIILAIITSNLLRSVEWSTNSFVDKGLLPKKHHVKIINQFSQSI